MSYIAEMRALQDSYLYANRDAHSCLAVAVVFTGCLLRSCSVPAEKPYRRFEAHDARVGSA
jgi:hypothetical protein